MGYQRVNERLASPSKIGKDNTTRKSQEDNEKTRKIERERMGSQVSEILRPKDP